MFKDNLGHIDYGVKSEVKWGRLKFSTQSRRVDKSEFAKHSESAVPNDVPNQGRRASDNHARDTERN